MGDRSRMRWSRSIRPTHNAMCNSYAAAKQNIAQEFNANELLCMRHWSMRSQATSRSGSHSFILRQRLLCDSENFIQKNSTKRTIQMRLGSTTGGHLQHFEMSNRYASSTVNLFFFSLANNKNSVVMFLHKCFRFGFSNKSIYQRN